MEFQLIYTIAPKGNEENPETHVIISTNILVIYPIIDPSGIIYSGSLNTPVDDATVTLYFGGNGDTPEAPVFFDMTPFHQKNPQTTDETGHYSWDVPYGWWQVVAEKNGFSAVSQWVHVLPAHTDLHLNLNLPSDKTGTYDLVSIKPHTTNGKIPARDFQAEITVTNFDTSKDADLLLMVATYGENGQFLSFQPKTISVKSGKTTTELVNVSNPNGKVKTVKAFLVDDFATMKPLSATVEFSNK